MTPYLDTPAGWDRVVKVIREKGVCGWDSETYGHEVDESTPVGRARVHVWSLAVSTGRMAARGHRVAAGVVLPASALGYGPVVELLEDPEIVKWAWNAPHDVHSAQEHGVAVAGWRDGLPLARVALPGLQRHGLKTVGPHLTGKPMRTFEETLTMEVEEYLDGRACGCEGAVPGSVFVPPMGPGGPLVRCKRRGRSKAHPSVQVLLARCVPRLQPLESVVPGHPLWDGLLEYAAEDAVMALECGELLERLGAPGPHVAWFPRSDDADCTAAW